MSSSGGNSIGVKVLSPGESPVVDIILVHGLEGDAYKTWTAKGGKKGEEVLWARDLLPDEIPEARILSYGYDSKVATFFDAASTNMIHNHAETMVSRLYNYRARRIKGQNSVERPIIWVCHSLGGIMLKRALIYSNSCGVDSNESLRSIKVSTQGILFLGTPHMGSSLAAWGSMAHKLMSILPGIDSKNTLIKTLETNSETLQNITSLFAGISTSFDICFFYEELPTLIGAKHELIVTYDSGVIVALPNTQRIGIHATHSNMCKYIDDEAPGYSDVAGVLRQMTDNAAKFTPARWKAEKEGSVVATDAAVDKILLNHPGRVLMPLSEAYSRSPSPARPNEAGASATRLLTRQDHDDSTSEISLPLNVPPFIVPYQRNESPVAREYILRDMDRILQNPAKLAVGNASLLLWGLPGSGKTHLVREYAFTRRSYFKGGIFWIKAKTHENRLDHFRTICSKLNLLKDEEEDGHKTSVVTRTGQEASVAVVVDWLAEHKNWLLVIDGANVDEESEITDLRELIPGGEGGSIIFTTLNKSLEGQARLGAPEGMKLPQMSVDEAVQILFSEANMGEPTAGEEKVAQDLVKSMDCLPLAVHLSANYITERQVSIFAYYRDFKEHPYVSGPGWSSTLGLTIDTLERKHPEAANLLRLISFFGLDIPVEFLMRGREKIPHIRLVAREEDGMLDFNLTIKHLLAFCLVRRSHEKETENGKEWKVDRLHFQNLITSYVRQRLGENAILWAKYAADMFCYAFDLAEQERGEDGAIYIKDYEVFMLHGSCLIHYMHGLNMDKKDTKPVRRQLHRAKEVKNNQITAQSEGNVITLPRRSIFGRGDMDSPTGPSRKGTFESTTSSSGGTDEHPNDRSSDSDHKSSIVNYGGLLMIEGSSSDGLDAPGDGVKSQPFEHEWQTVGKKPPSTASSDYRPSGPPTRGSYRGQRYLPRGNRGNSGRGRGRGGYDDYQPRTRSADPRYNEPRRGRPQARYTHSPASTNIDSPGRGRERAASNTSSNYTRSTVSSTNKISPGRTKPPSINGQNQNVSNSSSATTSFPVRQKPESLLDSNEGSAMDSMEQRMASGQVPSYASVAARRGSSPNKPTPRSRNSSRNSTKCSEGTLKPQGSTSRSSSQTSPLSRGSSSQGPESMKRVISHPYSEPVPELREWSPPPDARGASLLEPMNMKIDSNGNRYYEPASAHNFRDWYPPSPLHVEAAYPSHGMSGFMPAPVHVSTGMGPGFYMVRDPNAIEMPPGQYSSQQPAFENSTQPARFASNNNTNNDNIHLEPSPLPYPQGGAIFIPLSQANNLQQFNAYPIHPASAPQMSMHMSPSQTNLATRKPRAVSRDELRMLPGYPSQQQFVQRKQGFSNHREKIERSSRSRSAEKRHPSLDTNGSPPVDHAAEDAIFDLESDGRQSAETLAGEARPTSSGSDLTAYSNQTSDLAAIGMQFSQGREYSTTIAKDFAVDQPNGGSVQSAIPRKPLTDKLVKNTSSKPADATSALTSTLQKQDKGPLDRFSKGMQSITASLAWRSPAETKKKLGFQE